MAHDPKKYPANWKEIVARVNARDGNRCKFCGAGNGKWIVRHPENPFLFDSFDDTEKAWNFVFTQEGLGRYEVHASKPIRVVLTTAHLVDKDKMNADEANLAALCQRCHLILDKDDRVVSAATTRHKKRGQEPLL